MKDIFNREMFNRLYFEWLTAVYERNPEIATEGDKQVIQRLGKKMAQRIKDIVPRNSSTIDYIFEALKLSHWFQEKIEIVEKTDNYLILQTRGCSFQKHWIEKFNGVFYCATSHRAFLEAFCKEINPNSKIENLVSPIENPPDNIYCQWKISV